MKNPEPNCGKVGFSNEERNSFGELWDTDFIDAFRYRYSDKVEHSYWSNCMRVIPVESLDKIETQKVGKMTVTTPYQTIIDLVRYDCDLESTADSLVWWYDRYGS